MKRTITELENKLIGKGFRLSHKTYSGKHSQFVNGYVYLGCVFCETKYSILPQCIETTVVLDKKRQHILQVSFENKLHTINKENLNNLCEIYQKVEDFIYA